MKLRAAAAALLACAGAQGADCPALAGPSLAHDNARAEALFQRQVLQRAAVATPWRERPAGYISAADQGARGDGVADDTLALQQALDGNRRVWLQPGGVYRISRRLDLRDGMALVGDGTATLLMSAHGLDNRAARRTNGTLYGAQGVALGVRGAGVLLQGLFIVKEWVEDHYVVGVDVHEATDVVLRGLRLRGFSVAPGIVTVRSSERVEIVDTLIHDSCSASLQVPQDVASLQITAISVDDSRIGGRGSTHIRIANNVIVDLRMVPNTARGDQSDGVNFAAIGSGTGSLIEGNRIEGVDEGVDLFGSGILVRDNLIRAHSLAVKLIHGARRIEVRDNDLGAGRLGVIALYSARPPDAERQVREVLIQGNRLRALQRPAVFIDAREPLAPTDVTLRGNRTELSDCAAPPPACEAARCRAQDEVRLQIDPMRLCAPSARP